MWRDYSLSYQLPKETVVREKGSFKGGCQVELTANYNTVYVRLNSTTVRYVYTRHQRGSDISEMMHFVSVLVR